MPALDHHGTPLDVDERGFLIDPEEWSEDVALLLAREYEGAVELNDDHWVVIRFIRAFHQQHRLAPLVRVLCKGTGLKLKYIYELFPSGPGLGACKVAGLPGPDGCA